MAISSKLLAAGSLIIFLFLIIIVFLQNKNIKLTSSLAIYTGLSLFFVSPWLVFSFINTGNPFYPLFSQYIQMNFSISILSPLNVLSSLVNLFLRSQDPISPIYFIMLPLFVFYFKKLIHKYFVITVYSLLSLIVWYLLPHEGGGRFFLTYLPVMSLIVVAILEFLNQEKYKLYAQTVIFLIIFVSLITIIYRGAATYRFLPYLTRQENKEAFLSNNLNFTYGDFFDTDGYFRRHLQKNDKVLLYGFHNLYYLEFPFIDSSWVKKGDDFNYIAVQNSSLPTRFNFWRLVYENTKTKLKLYSLGGAKWIY